MILVPKGDDISIEAMLLADTAEVDFGDCSFQHGGSLSCVTNYIKANAILCKVTYPLATRIPSLEDSKPEPSPVTASLLYPSLSMIRVPIFT